MPLVFPEKDSKAFLPNDAAWDPRLSSVGWRDTALWDAGLELGACFVVSEQASHFGVGSAFLASKH